MPTNRQPLTTEQLAAITGRGDKPYWLHLPSDAQECKYGVLLSVAERDRLCADVLRQTKELNGWRELGEEMKRILEYVDKEDLLPDWFEPRLREFIARKALTP